MNITRDEAVAALRDIETAQVRAHTARRYWMGAPQLIMWGVIWVIGYTGSGLLPNHAIGPMWIALTLVGMAGGIYLNRRAAKASARMEGPSRVQGGRYWYVSFLAVWLFIVATYAVMRPTTNLPYLEFPALVVSLIYTFVGAWGQPRYFGIGSAIFVLSLIGFFFLPSILPYWLAVVGGGGLILGGLWLRQP